MIINQSLDLMIYMALLANAIGLTTMGAFWAMLWCICGLTVALNPNPETPKPKPQTAATKRSTSSTSYQILAVSLNPNLQELRFGGYGEGRCQETERSSTLLQYDKRFQHILPMGSIYTTIMKLGPERPSLLQLFAANEFPSTQYLIYMYIYMHPLGQLYKI